MIVLVYEIHDKGQMLHQSNMFACSGFDHANPVNAFRGSIYLTNIRFSNVHFSNMSTLIVLFEKLIIFSPLTGRLSIGYVFLTGGDRCFL